MTDRPLRILIATDTFAPDVNGAAKFTTRLAARLSKRGHEVHVVASALGRGKQGTHIEEHEGQRFTVHRLRSMLYPGHEWLRFAEPWRIWQNAASLLDALRPDVVHFQSHLVLGRAFSTEAKKRGIRVVGTNHLMFENLMDHSNIPRAMHGKAVDFAWHDAATVFGRCDVVTTPTRRSADYLERKTGITGVHAISCGLPGDEYLPNPERQRGRIVFVGRVTSEKRLETLVRAVSQLPTDLEWHLDIVGGGDLIDELGALARDLRVADRVTLTGFVSDDELRERLRSAEVFAMPSTAELQSIATMEAMATGLPVVAADAMALPHLVRDGANGWLFRPDDATDLSKKLERILRLDDDEYRAFQQHSLDMVAPHDIERTITAYERLYRGEEIRDPETRVELHG
ncbi:glycosyltransferase involved in cell wall biosynthesis [Agrococcus sp. UYP10]|uniref:glycosyltransferase n=1 Tax=Agrococcus sp. UYP10 TaxID=1756355 RepID=UPI0033916C60